MYFRKDLRVLFSGGRVLLFYCFALRYIIYIIRRTVASFHKRYANIAVVPPPRAILENVVIRRFTVFSGVWFSRSSSGFARANNLLFICSDDFRIRSIIILARARLDDRTTTAARLHRARGRKSTVRAERRWSSTPIGRTIMDSCKYLNRKKK